jgi:hypothetical protein
MEQLVTDRVMSSSELRYKTTNLGIAAFYNIVFIQVLIKALKLCI